ncbi:MAG: hypothetical protein WBL95_05450 [Microcoleus sp.]
MKELKKLEPNEVERMGAVRTQVKLTNAVDDELVRRGMLAPQLLRECEIAGLVDTGAVNLVIPQRLHSS